MDTSKKNQATKNPIIGNLKLHHLKKPFNFCCDINHQDFNTQYNMKNPPFESAFSDTFLKDSRPDLHFRLQDIAKSTVHRQPDKTGEGSLFQEEIEIKKKPSTYGRTVKNRGTLKWFLEDEIQVAQKILAEERQKKYEEKIKLQMLKNGKMI